MLSEHMTWQSAPHAPADNALDRWKAFQEIACCPVTRGPLALVSRDAVLGRMAAEERVRIDTDVIGALVSKTTGRAYLIRGAIVNFLEPESLQLDATSSSETTPTQLSDSAADVNTSVKSWYDEFGWRKNERGMYNDSALFSQTTPTGHGLYELLSHFRPLERLRGGTWLLDAASGAIAHPEYLSYSWFYDRRVCVDFSATALREAASKLGPSDYCCQADICSLPFRDDSFQGGISGYTIQHIHESQQATALQELYRVQAGGSHLCILTDMTYEKSHDLWYRAVRMVVRTLKALGRFTAESPSTSLEGATTSTAPALYFFPRPSQWWRQVGEQLTPKTRIESLRLFARHEFHGLFGRSNRAAQLVRAFEATFPRLLARSSAYCLVDLEKPVR